MRLWTSIVECDMLAMRSAQEQRNYVIDQPLLKQNQNWKLFLIQEKNKIKNVLPGHAITHVLTTIMMNSLRMRQLRAARIDKKSLKFSRERAFWMLILAGSSLNMERSRGISVLRWYKALLACCQNAIKTLFRFDSSAHRFATRMVLN